LVLLPLLFFYSFETIYESFVMFGLIKSALIKLKSSTGKFIH
jgi:hypothetical protein